ncbi:MAG: hypothetical protein AAGG75_22005, partial [Bacteroidota bacterium]
ITILSKNGNMYHLNSIFMDTYFLQFLEKLIGYDLDFNSFTKYDNGESVIIYPEQLAGKELYEKKLDSLQATINYILRQLMIYNIASGIIKRDIRQALLQ